jgi:hypothetical protein
MPVMGRVNCLVSLIFNFQKTDWIMSPSRNTYNAITCRRIKRDLDLLAGFVRLHGLDSLHLAHFHFDGVSAVSAVNGWNSISNCGHGLVLLELNFLVEAQPAKNDFANYPSRCVPANLDLRRHLKNFCDFLQDAFTLFGIVSLDGGRHAGIQMSFQDLSADLIQGRFHRLDLADDIDAVRILFHHADDTPQMALNGFQTSDGISVFHGSSIFREGMQRVSYPPPGGLGRVIITQGFSQGQALEAEKCHDLQV